MMILFIICQLMCVTDPWAHMSLVHSILSLKLGVTARGVADSLRVDLGVAVNRRLDVESAAARLEKELTEVQEILRTESNEHDLLHATIGVVIDALRVEQPVETSSLKARAMGVMAQVGQLEEDAFHTRITQAFAIVHSHYA